MDIAKNLFYLQLVALLLIVTFYFDGMMGWLVKRYAPLDEAHLAIRVTVSAIRLAISLFAAYFLLIMFAMTFVSIYL